MCKSYDNAVYQYIKGRAGVSMTYLTVALPAESASGLCSKNALVSIIRTKSVEVLLVRSG